MQCPEGSEIHPSPEMPCVKWNCLTKCLLVARANNADGLTGVLRRGRTVMCLDYMHVKGRPTHWKWRIEDFEKTVGSGPWGTVTVWRTNKQTKPPTISFTPKHLKRKASKSWTLLIGTVSVSSAVICWHQLWGLRCTDSDVFSLLENISSTLQRLTRSLLLPLSFFCKVCLSFPDTWRGKGWSPLLTSEGGQCVEKRGQEQCNSCQKRSWVF